MDNYVIAIDERKQHSVTESLARLGAGNMRVWDDFITAQMPYGTSFAAIDGINAIAWDENGKLTMRS
jgi:hypothetical protein